MTGGLIQLVAYGEQDLFLTRDPQITFFKVVYRRHTNFSIEQIPQYFISPPDFGTTATSIISRQGDLISDITLVMTLPKIKKTEEQKFAWIRKIGLGMIDYIEIEIGGQIIDRHYGEWINLWHEIFLSPNMTRAFNNMIGNIPEMFDYSDEKDSYTIYVPMQFWFCKNTGLSIPIVCLQYSDVKIRLVLKEAQKCYLTTPTNYIELFNDQVNLIEGEYIEQNINGRIASGIYSHYDIITNRLYYKKITKNDFITISTSAISVSEINNIIFNDDNNLKYIINGITSGYGVMPDVNVLSVSYTKQITQRISLLNCFLIVNYIYLEQEERTRYIQTKHDYLIEQVSYISQKTISGSYSGLGIEILQPSKFIVWVAQLQYLQDMTNNDYFNYTDSYIYENNKPIGKNLITNETIQLDGKERVSFRESQYFTQIQPYQYAINNINNGINMLSLSIFPDKYQPSGSCNMSQIDNIVMNIKLQNIININNIALFRAYSMNYNVLRIVNGLAGIVFTR